MPGVQLLGGVVCPVAGEFEGMQLAPLAGADGEIVGVVPVPVVVPVVVVPVVPVVGLGVVAMPG
jgi:hypothetical protein